MKEQIASALIDYQKSNAFLNVGDIDIEELSKKIEDKIESYQFDEVDDDEEGQGS